MKYKEMQKIIEMIHSKMNIKNDQYQQNQHQEQYNHHHQEPPQYQQPQNYQNGSLSIKYENCISCKSSFKISRLRKMQNMYICDDCFRQNQNVESFNNLNV